MGKEAFLRLVERSRVEVDHPGVRPQLYYLRVLPVVAARVDVYDVAPAPEFLGELEDVGVHPSGVLLPQTGHRAAVKAEDR